MARILLWDIELSYAIYYAYPSKRPQFLPAPQIKQRQFMICAAWQWYGSDKISAVSVLGDKKRFDKDHRDDYHVINTLHGVLKEADILVGHNSDQFDIKHFNYMSALHGLPPVAKKKSIDTLKEARKHFNAPSNSMDNLLKSFGHVGKQEKPTQADWFAATEGDVDSIKKATRYNMFDIEGQAFLYDKIRPYMNNHPNLNLYQDNRGCCPKCGEDALIKDGFTYTKTAKRQQYVCKSCGGYSSSGVNLLDKEDRVDIR